MADETAKPNRLETERDCVALATYEWEHELGKGTKQTWGMGAKGEDAETARERYIRDRASQFRTRLPAKKEDDQGEETEGNE